MPPGHTGSGHPRPPGTLVAVNRSSVRPSPLFLGLLGITVIGAVLCALPACYRVDLDELKGQIPAEEVKLADERSLMDLFPDCELGAEPPVGRLYGVLTLMDESLTADDHVTFQAGTHNHSVTMSLAEYRRVAQPEIAHFARHV